MKIRHAVVLLALSAIVVSTVYYINTLGVRFRVPENRINVSMQVPDVNSLVVDSNVMLRGVPVGKVTGIESTLNAATVHFYIDKRYPIPIDSEVRLENLSALGESYIGFLPRTAQGPMLRDGQQIAAGDIKQPASISELATSVVHVLDQMNPEQLRGMVVEADRALPDPRVVLPNLARAAMLLRNTVRSQNGRGSEVLANLQTLLQNAGFVGPRLGELTPMLQALSTPLYLMMWVTRNAFVDAGLPRSIENTGKILGRIQNFLDTRSPDLKVVAETLMPNVQGVAAALMNVDSTQILSNLLETVPEDGAIILHVATPNP